MLPVPFLPLQVHLSPTMQSKLVNKTEMFQH